MRVTTQDIAGISTILLDFSEIDIAGVDRGDSAAIALLVSFLDRVRIAIDGFVPLPAQSKPLVMALGFSASGLAPTTGTSPGAAQSREWLLDELVEARQTLREAIFHSGLWRVPSLYLGYSDATSPVIEIMNLFQMRLWLNDRTFFYGMPGHWCHDLFHNDPFFGASGVRAPHGHGWRLSVEAAQKTGMIDGNLVIPDFIANPRTHLPALTARFAQVLLDRERSAAGEWKSLCERTFRSSLETAKKRFSRIATDSARSLHQALVKEDLVASEIEFARAWFCLNGERDKSVRSKSRQTKPVPVYSPQMFGVFLDLAQEVMPAELLTAIAARKGMVFVSSSDSSIFSARITQQRQMLATLLGSSNAQVFWERNVIPLAGGPHVIGDSPSLPVIKPRQPATRGVIEWSISVPGEGSFDLACLPRLVARARSDESFSGMVIGELTGSEGRLLRDSEQFEHFPELLSLLRSLMDGVLLQPTIRPIHIRDLFQTLLSGYLNSLGNDLDASWQILSEAGWSLDDSAHVRKRMEETLSLRASPRVGKDRQASVFVTQIAWAMLSVLQEKIARNGVARELVRDISGAPCTTLVGIEGDEAAPVAYVSRMGANPVDDVYVSFVPWPASERWHGKPGRQLEYPVGVTARNFALKHQIRQFVSDLTPSAGWDVENLPLLLSILPQG
ncbi:MAG: hypothetical protein RIQ81_1720 [Pseudomonadota bacterium]|jgi:hypothetical protein